MVLGQTILLQKVELVDPIGHNYARRGIKGSRYLQNCPYEVVFY
jgi:hypothetical protein